MNALAIHDGDDLQLSAQGCNIAPERGESEVLLPEPVQRIVEIFAHPPHARV